jgi:hypothetical protein
MQTINTSTLAATSSDLPHANIRISSKKRAPSLAWRVVNHTAKVLRDVGIDHAEEFMDKRVLCRNLLHRLRSLAMTHQQQVQEHASHHRPARTASLLTGPSQVTLMA